jgi:phage gp45-like
MLDNLLRWVRVRGLKEGRMQRGRVEGLEYDARDGSPRPQDYGFAANAVDGDGLRLEVCGHTIILRLDRTAERPALAPYEVAVWHKEGHMVRLKAGRVVQVDCDHYLVNAQQYTVNASTGMAFNTPTATASGVFNAGSVAADASLKVGGKEVLGHNHGNVQNGGGITSGF